MLPGIRWQSLADYLFVAIAFYWLLRWARSARAMRIALGVVALHALALLARRLDIVVASWILDAAAILAILVLLLVFQPELRRAFMRMDTAVRNWPRRSSFGLTAGAATGPTASGVVANAAFALARDRVGALVVITRKDAIGELLEGGIALGAAISSELLEAIFQKVSPLHDGAAILEGNRLLKANVVLPLTHRDDVPVYYGTRHRAALGLAERSDALVVVVSEERGEVSLMDGRKSYVLPDPKSLALKLEGLSTAPKVNLRSRLHGMFTTNLGLKAAALSLAGLIWAMSFLASGTTIRTIAVPIEFTNVPAGMQVTSQSADALEVQVRGSPWIMDSVSLGPLVGNFNLGNFSPGWHSLHFNPQSLDLPPGVAVDQVTPENVRIRVEQFRTQHAQR